MVHLTKRRVQQFLARSGPARALSSAGAVLRVPGEAQCEEAAPPEVLRHDRVLRPPVALCSSQFGVGCSSGDVCSSEFWIFFGVRVCESLD